MFVCCDCLERFCIKYSYFTFLVYVYINSSRKSKFNQNLKTKTSCFLLEPENFSSSFMSIQVGIFINIFDPYCTVCMGCYNKNNMAKWKISVHCTVLHWTLLHYTLLYCTVLHFIALYCNALHCNAPYISVLYCNVHSCTVLHCTFIYCTAL